MKDGEELQSLKIDMAHGFKFYPDSYATINNPSKEDIQRFKKYERKENVKCYMWKIIIGIIILAAIFPIIKNPDGEYAKSFTQGLIGVVIGSSMARPMVGR